VNKRWFTALAMLLGIALMVWILAQADWAQLLSAIRNLSPVAIVAILLVYPLAALLDALLWMIWLRGIRPGPRWALQLWRAQLFGDAMQIVTPFGIAGSEAAKAVLLKQRHALPLADASASLAMVQVVLAIAQVPFLVIGFALLQKADVLSARWSQGLLIACTVIAVFMALVMIALHQRWLRHLPRLKDAGSDRSAFVSGLAEMEAQMSRLLHDWFKFALSLLLAFGNWTLFALEIWVMARALGKPVSFADAWAIEALISLARAATFFIPGHIGAQDGATSFAFKAFYMDPTTGVAIALVRRARELFWALASLPMNLDGWRKRS
jgi:glycosyltransferase 2 family protein